MKSERITVRIPMNAVTFQRLTQAIEAEWPGARMVGPVQPLGTAVFEVDPDQGAAHDDDQLLARLQAARADLEDLDELGSLHTDIGMAISRIRLAERAAREAVAVRQRLRPPATEAAPGTIPLQVLVENLATLAWGRAVRSIDVYHDYYEAPEGAPKREHGTTVTIRMVPERDLHLAPVPWATDDQPGTTSGKDSA